MRRAIGIKCLMGMLPLLSVTSPMLFLFLLPAIINAEGRVSIPAIGACAVATSTSCEGGIARAAAAASVAAEAVDEANLGLHLLQSQGLARAVGSGSGGRSSASAPDAHGVGLAAAPSARAPTAVAAAAAADAGAAADGRGASIADGIGAAEGAPHAAAVAVLAPPLEKPCCGEAGAGPQEGRGVEVQRLSVLHQELLRLHEELREVLPTIGPALDKVEAAMRAATQPGAAVRPPPPGASRRLVVGGVELEFTELSEFEADLTDPGLEADEETPVGDDNVSVHMSSNHIKVTSADSDVVHIHGPVHVKVQVLSGGHHPAKGSFAWWSVIVAATCLVLFAGLMSGLSIGLLSFQPMDLDVIERSASDEQEKEMAREIKKVVAEQHLLLVTLLICNAAAMEGLPVLLDDIMSPVSAVAFSVTAVLLFGEIIPQALCKSFGLKIGAMTTPVVRVLLVLCYPIAWPIAKVLDGLLGRAHGPLYRKSEMASLVTLEKEHGVLSESEALVMEGALAMATKRCYSCMTPMDEVYKIRTDALLDEATMDYMLQTGRSRLPVLGDHGGIVGIVMMKKLIKLRPEDATPVKSLHLSPILHVSEDRHLFDMLESFQTGRSHMAAVYDRSVVLLASQTKMPKGATPIGIITLTDVIEELIRSELRDDCDHSSIASITGSSVVGGAAAQLLDSSSAVESNKDSIQESNKGRQRARSTSELATPPGEMRPGLVSVLRMATSGSTLPLPPEFRRSVSLGSEAGGRSTPTDPRLPSAAGCVLCSSRRYPPAQWP